jgi:signal transduction histidine kinase
LESFSYSVSHDLRAPLRAIDGFSRILEEDALDRLKPDEVDALARIRRATDRMASLIDDLLSLSKATRAPLTRIRIDMTNLAREVATVQVLHGKKIAVEIREDGIAIDGVAHSWTEYKNFWILQGDGYSELHLAGQRKNQHFKVLIARIDPGLLASILVHYIPQNPDARENIFDFILRVCKI